MKRAPQRLLGAYLHSISPGKTLPQSPSAPMPSQIEIAVPVTMALTSEAKFEVRTPRAFKVRFTKVGLDSYVNTPQLTSSLDIPESITVMGNKVDLTLLR